MRFVTPKTEAQQTLSALRRVRESLVRRLLVQCARAYMQHLDRQTDRLAQWVRAILARRHSNVVACALANKLARTAWAIAAKHTEFKTQEIVMPT